MKTKEQNISTQTLFAAAIGCLMQFALGVFIMISPFLLSNIIAAFLGPQSATRFMAITSTTFMQSPMIFVVGLACLLIATTIFAFASTNIRKNKKVKSWSILSLISAFLLIYFGTSILQIAAIFGFIGSIAGLMHRESAKK